MDSKRGIVYFITNDAMPGLIKIGKTKMEEVEIRIKQLYRGNTSVPLPFKCLFAAEVDDCFKIERLAHKVFDKARLNPNREFFLIESEAMLEWVKLMNWKDVTPKIQKELNQDVSKAEIDAAKKLPKRPPLNFTEMGMKIGEELIYVKNPQIKATIRNTKKVEYNDELYSLTALTKMLLKKDYDVQPTPYWEYKGRSLQLIYNETYPINN